MNKNILYGSAAEKLPPKYEGYVELNERMYNPGDTITGKAHLELRKKLYCDTINIKLYGSVRVFFTETIPSNKPGQLTRNQAYEQEIVLVNQEQKLWTSPKEGPNKKPEITLDDIARMARSTSIRPLLPKTDLTSESGLDPGGYDYTFAFDLPKEGLYTSFEAKHAAGCVRYYVILEVKNNDYVVYKKKLLFPVVIPVHLENNIKAIDSFHTSESIPYAKGIIKASLEVKKRGYVPGEAVEGTITIENNSKESVKTAFLRIYQKTEAYSRNPDVKYKDTVFETAGMGLPINKILAGQTYSYPINFYIPALMPNFEIDACLKMSYELKLTIGRNRNCLCKGILDLSIPIFIGTHPTSEINYNKPSAPSENQFYSAPPSYAECVGGFSEIKDDDEPVVGDYSPLLMYQYDFHLRHRVPKYEE